MWSGNNQQIKPKVDGSMEVQGNSQVYVTSFYILIFISFYIFFFLFALT